MNVSAHFDAVLADMQLSLIGFLIGTDFFAGHTKYFVKFLAIKYKACSTFRRFLIQFSSIGAGVFFIFDTHIRTTTT